MVKGHDHVCFPRLVFDVILILFTSLLGHLLGIGQRELTQTLLVGVQSSSCFGKNTRETSKTIFNQVTELFFVFFGIY